jgi:hypothetical protein
VRRYKEWALRMVRRTRMMEAMRPRKTELPM